MRFSLFCRAGLCSSLLLAGPALAAPKPLVPGAHGMDKFVLVPERRATGANVEAMPANADLPVELRDAAPSETLLAELPSLTSFLTIRNDLRFLVNAAIKDVRKERIALGLHFARAF